MCDSSGCLNVLSGAVLAACCYVRPRDNKSSFNSLSTQSMTEL